MGWGVAGGQSASWVDLAYFVVLDLNQSSMTKLFDNCQSGPQSSANCTVLCRLMGVIVIEDLGGVVE